MKYKSADELDTMDLHDAAISDIDIMGEELGDNVLRMELQGCIIKDGNSQNDFYVEKYSDSLELRFLEAEIEAILLEGHKYYDANDKLISQVPDKKIPEKDYTTILKSFKDCYIFYGGIPKDNNNKSKKCYQMIIDKENAQGEEESYVVSIKYEKAVASWDRFLNKVYR